MCSEACKHRWNDSVHEEAKQRKNKKGREKGAAAQHNFMEMMIMNKKMTADAL